MKMKYKDLKVMDIVRLGEGPFLDAAVIKVTAEMVTFFRPYITFRDGPFREDIVTPLIGREEFAVYRSDVEVELLRRDE